MVIRVTSGYLVTMYRAVTPSSTVMMMTSIGMQMT